MNKLFLAAALSFSAFAFADSSQTEEPEVAVYEDAEDVVTEDEVAVEDQEALKNSDLKKK